MEVRLLDVMSYGLLKEDCVKERFKQILQLVKLILAIPIHRAKCEQGFSLMVNDRRADVTCRVNVMNNLRVRIAYSTRNLRAYVHQAHI